MNPRHCLTCKSWDRTVDAVVGYCQLCEERFPLRIHRLRFQLENCDCGGYVFAEHRQPYREKYHALRELEVTR